MAVTPFARWVEEMGRSAKVAPEPPFVRRFHAGRKGATGCQLNRALYGRSAPRRFSERYSNGILRGSNCARDGGRPPGFGLQDQNPNHQLLLSPNGLGSEQVWKRRGLPVRYVLERRTNLNRCRGVESIGMSSKPGSSVIPGIKFGGNLITAQTVTGI